MAPKGRTWISAPFEDWWEKKVCIFFYEIKINDTQNNRTRVTLLKKLNNFKQRLI